MSSGASDVSQDFPATIFCSVEACVNYIEEMALWMLLLSIIGSKSVDAQVLVMIFK